MVALAGTLAPPSRLAWLFVTCNSLAVQCPDAADLWDPVSNGELTLSDVAMQSKKVVAWKGPDGRQRQERVQNAIRKFKRQHISLRKAGLMM